MIIINIISSCNYHRITPKDINAFIELNESIDYIDPEAVFCLFLFNYGRFPSSISEIIDSAQNDPGTIEWISWKLRDPFSSNNESFKYLSFNNCNSYLLLSRGPDRKFNKYSSDGCDTEIDYSHLLADSNCTEATNYSGKDIIVLFGKARPMLLTYTKVINEVRDYFNEMIALKKQYTHGYRNILLYIDSTIFRVVNYNLDSTNCYIDILHNEYCFRFSIAAGLNPFDVIEDKLNDNFSISGVYSNHDIENKIFLYEHCIFEPSLKPLDIIKLYQESRYGFSFDINRCDFSLDDSIQR